METKDYFLVLGPLLGVLLGGGLTTTLKVIELRHQWTAERQRHRLGLLEAAYNELVLAGIDATTLLHHLKRIHKRVPDSRQRKIEFEALTFGGRFADGQTWSTIALYFPDLIDARNRILLTKTELENQFNQALFSEDLPSLGSLLEFVSPYIGAISKMQEALGKEILRIEASTRKIVIPSGS